MEIDNQEESALVGEFNANAFMNTDSLTVDNETEQGNEESQEGISDEHEVSSTDGQASEDNESGSQEDNADSAATDDSETDWSLDANSSSSSKEEEVQEGDSDSEGDSSGGQGNDTDSQEGWEEIADTLGINADSYEAFIDSIKKTQELAQAGASDEKTKGLESLIDLGDEQLVRKELEVQGYSPEDIEDEIDIMIENNTIRSKARQVRKDLEGALAQHRQAIANQTTETDAMQQRELEEARQEISDFMSKTNEMFGGRINSQQRAEHTEYISSQKFYDEITESPQTIAEAAWLWKYRHQIIKGYKSAGVEQGKAAILDRMVNPETTRKTVIPDPETGDFNPSRFLDSGETM